MFWRDCSVLLTHQLILTMSRFESLPLQAEERVCKAEAHFGATSRGSSSARVPSERRMKAQGLHRLSSLPVSAVCFIIPPPYFSPQSKQPSHTVTQTRTFISFYSCFLSFWPLSHWESAVFSTFVTTCLFSFCPHLTPAFHACASLSVSCSFALYALLF